MLWKKRIDIVLGERTTTTVIIKKTIEEVCQLKNDILGDGGNGKILVKGHKVAVMQDE